VLAGLSFLWLAFSVFPAISHGEVRTDQLPWSASWQSDAPLLAIEFLDRQHGWAVGGRGVVLKTSDGGGKWESVSLPTAATVTSVHFVDDQRGWIATAEQLPYSSTTLGTIWRTADGGKTWAPNQSQRLPAITRVCFLDARRGLATVLAGGMYSAGLIASTDGGRTWSELPIAGSDVLKSPVSQWCGLERSHAGSLIAGTRRGYLVVWDGSSATLLKPSRGGDRSDTAPLEFDAMTVSPSDRAVGLVDGFLYERGLAGARPWSATVPGATAHPASAVAAQGKSIWLAGAEGGVIWHSRDDGRTWSDQRLPIQAPLRDLTFVDEQAGWGVGDGGLIVATLDGGKTWTVQRGSADRVAVYCVAIDYRDLPWELLAEWAGRECYRVHVTVLGVPAIDGASRHDALEAGLREALFGLGCQSVSLHSDFALPPQAVPREPSEIERNWRERHRRWGKASVGMTRLDGLLQAELMTYRPAVVAVVGSEHDQELLLTDYGDGDVSLQFSGPTELLRDAVGSAIGEQLRGEGSGENGGSRDLIPAVLQLTPATAESAMRMRLDAFLSRRATTVREAARVAAASVGSLPQFEDHFWAAKLETPTGVVSVVRSLENLVPHRADMRRNMAGSDLPETRVGTSDDPLVRQRQAIAAMFRNVAAEQHAMNAGWKSQLQQMVLESTPDVERRLVLETAQQLWFAARFDDAEPLFQKLIESSASHGICDAVMQGALRRETSAELAYLRMLQEQTLAKDKPVPAADIARVAYAEEGVAKKWHAVAEQTLPDLQFDPRWQMAMASLERTGGDNAAAETRYRRVQQLVSATRTERWYATTELALLAGDMPEAQVSIVWREASVPPHLDGQLDETAWQFPPTYHDAAQGVTLWAAGDQEYLYVACRVSGGDLTGEGALEKRTGAAATQQIPPRDDHFVSDDRVRLRMDTNRDFLTGWELTFGASGRVTDACDGVAGWNPKFYRAVAQDEHGWNVEVAIPWRAIVAEQNDRAVWLIDIQRMVPGVCHYEDASPRADEWKYFYRQISE
jgi:photosystem II stability/assembly factor-like uncharacterized protein